ncbi:MAG: hypothetical protein KIT20_04725 [Alphaproteobacteria bacterium]|nr:hypothetical protein [Alphaproteobacteria bacterium]
MSDRQGGPATPKREREPDEAASRQRRLEEALRANLRRRKQQERARIEIGGEPPDPDRPT